MINKIIKIVGFPVLGALGLGIGGAVLGYIQTTDNTWFWLIGLAVIGLVEGAMLVFFLGGRKRAPSLAFFGAIAGVVGGFLTGGSGYEPWLQLAIIGAVGGVVLGAAFALTDFGRKDRDFNCDECNAKVSKKDKYCPNCGTEFER